MTPSPSPPAMPAMPAMPAELSAERLRELLLKHAHSGDCIVSREDMDDFVELACAALSRQEQPQVTLPDGAVERAVRRVMATHELKQPPTVEPPQDVLEAIDGLGDIRWLLESYSDANAETDEYRRGNLDKIDRAITALSTLSRQSGRGEALARWKAGDDQPASPTKSEVARDE
jgi:hypothetical protein